jgi:hypothetical protein
VSGGYARRGRKPSQSFANPSLRAATVVLFFRAGRGDTSHSRPRGRALYETSAATRAFSPAAPPGSCYILLYYTILRHSTLHHTTVHYIALHCISLPAGPPARGTLHYTTFHHSTFHSIAFHSIPLNSIPFH